MADGTSSLLALLGVVIGFSVVMLLLSLVVTSLAQATQAALRLRARNLQRGLASILDATSGNGLARAREVLNQPEIALVKRRRNPNGMASRMLGPVVSWIEPEELRRALDYPEGDVTERFARAGPMLRKRFAMVMKGVSLAWGLAVAVVFQVSAPELLRQLSIDPELRARYVAAAPGILERREGSVRRLTEGRDASLEALDELIARHPGLGEELSGVSRSAVYPEGVAEDLAEALEPAPTRAALVAEYEALVDARLRQQRDVALAESRAAVDELSLLSIAPWRHGRAFYVKDGRIDLANAIGVAMTAILLSLGAPFWFNQLQNAVSYRDLLKPRPAGTGEEADTGKATNGKKPAEKAGGRP